MTFARYKGVDQQFIRGKVYLVRTEMDSSGDAVSTNHIEVFDDLQDKWITVKSNLDWYDESGVDRFDFDFLAEVYAVVKYSFEEFSKGQVVVLCDADYDSKLGTSNVFLNIKGSGFFKSELMIILDYTTVVPGMMVMDESSGIWCKIITIDESMWMETECNPLKQSPETFRFSVDKDGDIQFEPFVMCVDDNNGMIGGITKGKYYRVVKESGYEPTPEDVVQFDDHVLTVIDDTGKERDCNAERFC